MVAAPSIVVLISAYVEVIPMLEGPAGVDSDGFSPVFPAAAEAISGISQSDHSTSRK